MYVLKPRTKVYKKGQHCTKQNRNKETQRRTWRDKYFISEVTSSHILHKTACSFSAQGHLSCRAYYWLELND